MPASATCLSSLIVSSTLKSCFILDGISPGRRRIELCPSQRDDTEEVIFNLKNIFFLLSSTYNLVSLALLYNHDIFYNNKNEIFYNLKTKEVLA